MTDHGEASTRVSVAEAETVEDLAPLISGAELLRQYAKRAALGLRTQNEAAKLKIEAQSKAGEMLAAMDKQAGARTPTGSREATPSLADQGVTKAQSHYWQKVGRVPPDIRQRYYAMVERNVRRAELEALKSPTRDFGLSHAKDLPALAPWLGVVLAIVAACVLLGWP